MLRGGLLGRWLSYEVLRMELRVLDVYGGRDGDEG